MSWDFDAPPAHPLRERDEVQAGGQSAFEPEVLSLFAEPGVSVLTAERAARALKRPHQDVETTLQALAQQGAIRRDAETGEYRIGDERKAELERMFYEAAEELGETQSLVALDQQQALATKANEDDEPRLPITAGILSLFLPGTGQLLNGDIGRASLVFAVWALAMLTPYQSIITFVRLYAGAEAFFNAKIRRLERQQALQAARRTRGAPRLPA